MASKAGRGSDQFMVRFPDGMRDRIKAAAEQNGRSMNVEIVSRLQDSFEDHGEALAEAAAVAESLRQNLTRKIDAHDEILTRLNEQSRRLADLEDELEKRELALEEAFEEKMRERVEELEKTYQDLIERAQKRWEQADEYAGFTIAREQQFIATIKALTGKEPPAAEPVTTAYQRRKQKKNDERS